MSIGKIVSFLHLNKFASKRKVQFVNPDKIVKIIDKSIPGDSFEQLTLNKAEIAKYANEKGLSNVVFYDPRRNIGEISSLNVESSLAGRVGIMTKSNSGIAQNESVDFFEAPKSEFLNKVYDKLADIIRFNNIPAKSTISIDSLISKNMSERTLKGFQTKVLKEAEVAKISNIEITTERLNGKSTNVLKLTRKTDTAKSTRTYYFGDCDISPDDALKVIKKYNSKCYSSSITGYSE